MSQLGLGLSSALSPLTPSPNLELEDYRLSKSVLWWMPEKCPMMHWACRLCNTQARGLVRTSAGFSFPGMQDIWMEPLSFQSEIAKYGMAMCCKHSVGATASTIIFVDWLSLCIMVGSSCANFRWCRMKRKYQTILAAETTTQNSASVELRAVYVCVLEQ